MANLNKLSINSKTTAPKDVSVRLDGKKVRGKIVKLTLYFDANSANKAVMEFIPEKISVKSHFLVETIPIPKFLWQLKIFIKDLRDFLTEGWASWRN